MFGAGGIGGAAAGPAPAWRAFPYLMAISDFYGSRPLVLAINSYSADCLGEQQQNSFGSMQGRRPEQSPIVEAQIPEDLRVDLLDQWRTEDVLRALKASFPISDASLERVRAEQIDGATLLNCNVIKLEDKLSKLIPVGEALKLVHCIYSLRLKWDRRPFACGRSTKYRIQVSCGMSVSLMELLLRVGETFPQITVVNYLQKQPNFAGNLNLDPLMASDRPEGDVLRQIDFRRVQLVSASQAQSHYGTMMPNSSQQTQIIHALQFECETFLFHEKVSNRDMGKLEVRANKGVPPDPQPNGISGVTLIASWNCKAPKMVRWDGAASVQWSPAIHQLLPRFARLAIRELFYIRTLRKSSILAKLDMHLFTVMATTVMGEPYVFPLLLYPGRDEFSDELEARRQQRLDY